jgi:hypothetical protein
LVLLGNKDLQEAKVLSDPLEPLVAQETMGPQVLLVPLANKDLQAITVLLVLKVQRVLKAQLEKMVSKA